MQQPRSGRRRPTRPTSDNAHDGVKGPFGRLDCSVSMRRRAGRAAGFATVLRREAKYLPIQGRGTLCHLGPVAVWPARLGDPGV